MKRYHCLIALLLFMSVSLLSCKDEKEEEELEFAKKELKNNMLGTWDWKNYNEHAVYTFKSTGIVTIAFDRNNGTVSTSEETWDTTDGKSFFITSSSSSKSEYKNVSVVKAFVGSKATITMKGEICDKSDCDTETWIQE